MKSGGLEVAEVALQMVAQIYFRMVRSGKTLYVFGLLASREMS